MVVESDGVVPGLALHVMRTRDTEPRLALEANMPQGRTPDVHQYATIDI
jgi:hypothetical protein